MSISYVIFVSRARGLFQKILHIYDTHHVSRSRFVPPQSLNTVEEEHSESKEVRLFQAEYVSPDEHGMSVHPMAKKGTINEHTPAEQANRTARRERISPQAGRSREERDSHRLDLLSSKQAGIMLPTLRKGVLLWCCILNRVRVQISKSWHSSPENIPPAQGNMNM